MRCCRDQGRRGRGRSCDSSRGCCCGCAAAQRAAGRALRAEAVAVHALVPVHALSRVPARAHDRGLSLAFPVPTALPRRSNPGAGRGRKVRCLVGSPSTDHRGQVYLYHREALRAPGIAQEPVLDQDRLWAVGTADGPEAPEDRRRGWMRPCLCHGRCSCWSDNRSQSLTAESTCFGAAWELVALGLVGLVAVQKLVHCCAAQALRGARQNCHLAVALTGARAAARPLRPPPGLGVSSSLPLSKLG